MTNTNPPTKGTPIAEGQALAGEVVARNFDGWSPELLAEFEANAENLDVGGRLLSETETLKVWEIRLYPGERLPAHRHVLDYFWTAITAGTSRQHTDDGSTRIVHYTPGQTRHFTFGPGQYLLHDLENHGDTPLTFITVEHKPSRT